tara:strand:- start:2626 stop:2850 length:225 start_codon:yes stop_codon:yes gene_type:complete
MPFYTFKCRTCDLEQEELRKMDDFKEPLCPVCCYNTEVDGALERMEKIVSNVGKPQFKGNGFYETDYKRAKARP